MIKIEEYMVLSREERRKHLNLSEACIERGGDSRQFRGLLAHVLDTTIPSGLKTYLCHACHNGKCSNPNHLYWGSAKDNVIDQIENGTWKPLNERMQEKYGADEWKRRSSENMRRGQKKSAEYRRYSDKQVNDYRALIVQSDPTKRGWVKRASELLNVSHTQVRRFTQRFCEDMNLLKK